MWYRRCRWLCVVALVGLAGCNKPPGDGPPGTGGKSGGQAGAIRFWHTQTQENQQALDQIVTEFNAAHPDGPPVEATYIGDYDQLFEKLKAFTAGKDHTALPDLAVAYESQIAEYMKADVVRPLDDLLADPTGGLTKEQLDDIYPPYLETNRFKQFGGKLLSFPFPKSNLMLYYNASMLKEVGLQPPQTWDEFVDDCRKIKAKRHITPYACSVDPSTVDGMIFSMGGELLDDAGRPQFDQPAATAVLKLIDSLFKAARPGEELGYQVVDKGDQNNDFANEKCAFFFRSSTARPFIQKLVGRKFASGMCGLPSGPGAEPATIMFVGNIFVFKSTPEREKKAWEFI
ncbi:MAG: extracellular solute-binding protein, partial [Armatimonadetes bacterium]|nr:extracellular solute-binding protein [Armatimonadota bacterium]